MIFEILRRKREKETKLGYNIRKMIDNSGWEEGILNGENNLLLIFCPVLFLSFRLSLILKLIEHLIVILISPNIIYNIFRGSFTELKKTHNLLLTYI